MKRDPIFGIQHSLGLTPTMANFCSQHDITVHRVDEGMHTYTP
jgi:hypothetical protein